VAYITDCNTHWIDDCRSDDVCEDASPGITIVMVSYHGMRWHNEELGMDVTHFIYFEWWLVARTRRFVILSQKVALPGMVIQSFNEKWNKC
jgi:hypothetical protein